MGNDTQGEEWAVNFWWRYLGFMTLLATAVMALMWLLERSPLLMCALAVCGGER